MTTRIIITKVSDPDEVVRQLLPKMTNLGNAIAQRMQRLVPKKTWALHDTISAETTASGGVVTTVVGAGGGKVNYALYVELGTSRQAAQPYIRPALLQSKAGDLNYSGGGPLSHGEQQTARRERRNANARARYLGSANR